MDDVTVEAFPKRSLPVRPEVALWRWSLLVSPERQAELWGILSKDEQARAERFHFPRDRRRYVVGRGTLRMRLAAYLGCPPAAVALSCGEFGKPILQDPEWRARLSFNLSHSEELAILAITGGAPVGVDVERIRPIARDLALHSFTNDEIELLDALPKEAYAAGVLACWTRREAYVKALGTGLSHPPGSFAVSVHPALPARLLRIDGDPAEIGHWILATLAASPGYAAALAVRQPDCTVKWHSALR